MSGTDVKTRLYLLQCLFVRLFCWVSIFLDAINDFINFLSRFSIILNIIDMYIWVYSNNQYVIVNIYESINHSTDLLIHLRHSYLFRPITQDLPCIFALLTLPYLVYSCLRTDWLSALLSNVLKWAQTLGSLNLN